MTIFNKALSAKIESIRYIIVSQNITTVIFIICGTYFVPTNSALSEYFSFQPISFSHVKYIIPLICLFIAMLMSSLKALPFVSVCCIYMRNN